MKNKIRQAVKIISFCLILAISVNLAYSALSWKDSVGEYSSAMKTLQKLEDNTVDVLFLGSSHCYCGVNPSLLYDKYGIGSFSAVISGQEIGSTYYCLEEVYKTQSPKIVFVELYSALFEKQLIEHNIYRNVLSFPISSRYINIVNDIAPQENKPDYLLRWPIMHTRYKELKKYDFTEPKHDFMGHTLSFSYSEIAPFTQHTTTDTMPLFEGKEQWIKKIIELAKSNGSEIYFFLAPYNMSEDDFMRVNYTEKLLNSQNVELINFYNMIDEVGIDYKNDFLDASHLSTSGADKITEYLGEFIKSKYDIPNRKGDSSYTLWEEDLKYFKNGRKNRELSITTDVKDYLSALKKSEHYTVAICTYGDYISDETDISRYMADLGINIKNYPDSGAWVIHNGEVIFSSADEDFIFSKALEDTDIVVRSSGGDNQIIVERSVKRHLDNGFAVLVYDNENNLIADYVNFNAAKNYYPIRYD